MLEIFLGLNFSVDELAEGIEFAHARSVKIFLAVNSYARAGNSGPWVRAVDNAAQVKSRCDYSCRYWLA